MNKQTLIITLVGALAVIGFFALAYKATNTPQQRQHVAEATIVLPTDHIKWAPAGTGKAILLEYSDLQCPACKTYHSLIASWEQDPAFKPVMEHITFVYRQFPLVQIHKNAYLAARIGEAVAAQHRDAFFIYADKAFTAQSDWAEDDAASASTKLLQYAALPSIDVKKVQDDMQKPEFAHIVDAMMASGSAQFVQGTPTFYLNGEQLGSDILGNPDTFKQKLLELATK